MRFHRKSSFLYEFVIGQTFFADLFYFKCRYKTNVSLGHSRSTDKTLDDERFRKSGNIHSVVDEHIILWQGRSVPFCKHYTFLFLSSSEWKLRREVRFVQMSQENVEEVKKLDINGMWYTNRLMASTWQGVN